MSCLQHPAVAAPSGVGSSLRPRSGGITSFHPRLTTAIEIRPNPAQTPAWWGERPRESGRLLAPAREYAPPDSYRGRVSREGGRDHRVLFASIASIARNSGGPSRRGLVGRAYPRAWPTPGPGARLRSPQQRWLRRGPRAYFTGSAPAPSARRPRKGQKRPRKGLFSLGEGLRRHGFGQIRQGFAGILKGFGRRPKGFAGRPKGVACRPKGFAGRPKGFGCRRKGFGCRRKGFGSQPKGFDSQPKGFGSRPKGFGGHRPGLVRHSERSGRLLATMPLRSNPKAGLAAGIAAGSGRRDSVRPGPRKINQKKAGHALRGQLKHTPS